MKTIRQIGFTSSDEEERSPLIGVGTITQLTEGPPVAAPDQPSALGFSAAAIALKAASLVGGDRATTHGDKRQNHENIAALWNAYLSIRREPGSPLRARDVTNMMALLKVARMETGTFNPDDSVDGVGYIAITGQLDAEDNGKESPKFPR